MSRFYTKIDFISIILTLLLSLKYSADADCGIPTVKPIVFGKTYNRIINGENAVQGSWPWIVSLQQINDDGTLFHFCGGTLIDLDLVITAAHCVLGMSVNEFMVVVGLYDVTIKPNSSNIISPLEYKMHSSFTVNTVNDGFDIALIQLSNKVNLSTYIGIICLPNSSQANLVLNQNVIVAGW